MVIKMYKPTEKQEDYMQKHYDNRIGSVYGDYVVRRVWYDWERGAQMWEMECTECGDIRITKQGKEYAKGRNKGICRECQKRKKEESK